MGTSSLIDKLTKIFYKHISLHMPGIIKEIKKQRDECKAKKRDLG